MWKISLVARPRLYLSSKGAAINSVPARRGVWQQKRLRLGAFPAILLPISMAAASLRQSAPRIETPKISPRPKAAISLEEWEVKTPLTDSEARSVARLQRACEEKPIPEQVHLSSAIQSLKKLRAGI